MNTTILISLVSLFFCFIYVELVYRFFKLKDKYRKALIKNNFFENQINSIEENKIQDQESVHKENFIKFLSDSRDWAFDYIEEVQEGLYEFVDNVDPYIQYFDEYGDVLSIERPDYAAMSQISKSYKELKQLLPKEKK